MLSKNIVRMTDAYKFGHWSQYPEDTANVYSYFESRGGLFSEVVFFGLQYIIKKYLEGEVVTREGIDEAARLARGIFDADKIFNLKGWNRLLEKYQGVLPVRIKAVPEGTAVPTHNIMLSIEGTDEEFPWLVNYLETLLVQVWYPCTVATLSREIKKIFFDYAMNTGGLLGIDYKLHDFGFRGVSSAESAGIGGAAHLVNFKGTDTAEAVYVAQEFYGAQPGVGCSIPASEHSTITSWGQLGEQAAYQNMLKQYPNIMFACVSDSFNIWEACREIWGEALRPQLRERHHPVVIRPDSGDPIVVVPELMRILDSKFGSTKNRQGYKVLAPCVRLIQGDGVNYDSIQEILEAVRAAGYSFENLAFGMGGALLQQLNRDTQKFAFKCAAINRAGEWIDVWKDPITDKGKASKRGHMVLVNAHNTLVTRRAEDLHDDADVLQTVFENGKLLIDQKFDDIRARANAWMKG